MPKDSVVILNVDCEQHVGDALLRSARQTERELESINLNDCSTNCIRTAMNGPAALGRRIRVMSGARPDRPGMARNRGNSLRRGEYIRFPNGDDGHYPTLCIEVDI
jgi:hypothetical protein